MTALSDHLFWDVDRSCVDPVGHAAWLAKRVLEHGRWSDWQILIAHYGKPELAGLVTGLRSLEPRAFATFVALGFNFRPLLSDAPLRCHPGTREHAARPSGC